MHILILVNIVSEFIHYSPHTHYIVVAMHNIVSCSVLCIHLSLISVMIVTFILYRRRSFTSLDGFAYSHWKEVGRCLYYKQDVLSFDWVL